MPVLKNARHEKFAQLVANGSSASKAYAEAGYSNSGQSANKNAPRLMANEGIKARIDELSAKVESAVIQLIAVDKQWVMDRLIENANAAMEKGQRAVANRSLELIGKEFGMFIDRKELTHTVKPIEEMLTEIEGPR